MLDNLLTPDPSEVLQVSDLTRQIKRQLEGQFRGFWVRGEVSNLRKQASGHIYFSLKDAGAQLPCVLFARDANRQSFELSAGMELTLFGDISVYEPHGRYQLIVKIAIQSGEGRLQLEFERLKRKLNSEGLFATERKSPLPTLPQRIAVITSPTGAAIRDFLRILQRRNYCGEVIVLPARVQGKEAPAELRHMLKYAIASQPNFDLIVLTRGGGSIEDLWAFNDEALARAIADCPIPVLSAVGHEIDHVLSDYVADERAETPSGAAERISSLYLASRQQLDSARKQLHQFTHYCLDQANRQLDQLQGRMHILAPERQVQLRSMQLDDLEHQLTTTLNKRIATEKERLSARANQLTQVHPSTRIQLAQQELDASKHRLDQGLHASLRHQTEHLEHLAKRLENSGLQATLKRGYSILSAQDGRIIDSSKKIPQNEPLSAKFHDGKATLYTKP